MFVGLGVAYPPVLHDWAVVRATALALALASEVEVLAVRDSSGVLLGPVPYTHLTLATNKEG